MPDFSRRQLNESWKQERAFRVGMTLARVGVILAALAIVLDYMYIPGLSVFGDLLLLFGCLASIVFSDPKENRRHFVWQPMYIGYIISSTLTIFQTGGITSPLAGMNIALLFVSGLVIQTRFGALAVYLWSTAYVISIMAIEPFIQANARAALPVEFAAIGAIVNLVAIAYCSHGFLKTEIELAEEFETRYRELFETKSSLSREEAANAAKSNFLANISHELRTPLGAILGYVELLNDAPLDTEKREYLDIVKRNGTQLSRLVNDLLDLSKVEAGRLDVEQVEFEPSLVLSEVLDLFELAAEKKNLSLKCSYLNPVPQKMIGDPVRLKQILMNLVSNAVKFTDSGSVSINVQFIQSGHENNETQLVISVSDTGRGLSREEQQKLFQPFTQADSSMSRKYGGTGLGLSLSQKLARLLNGDLKLAFSEPGAGSVFSLNMRAARATGSPLVNAFEFDTEPNTPVVQPAEVSLRGAEILVVDDTADNRGLLKKFLEAAGARVECAIDGAEGIQKALSKIYDVVLMDIQMPGLDGVQATSILRQKAYKGPILALTAHAMKQDRERCLAAGCTDHLTKPVRRTELLMSVARYIRSPRRSPHLIVSL